MPPSDYAQLPKFYCLRMRHSSPLVSHVIGLRLEHNKILGTVVEDIAVDVVNNFSFPERAADFFCSDDSMLIHPPDAVIYRRMFSLISCSAFVGAKLSAALTFIGGAKIKTFLAISANPFRSRTTRYRVTGLRAPLTLTWLSAGFALVHRGIVDARARDIQWYSPACLTSKPSQFNLFGVTP